MPPTCQAAGSYRCRRSHNKRECHVGFSVFNTALLRHPLVYFGLRASSTGMPLCAHTWASSSAMGPELCAHLPETVLFHLLPSSQQTTQGPASCPPTPLPASRAQRGSPWLRGAQGGQHKDRLRAARDSFLMGMKGTCLCFFFLTYKWCQSYRVSSISCLCTGEPGGSSSPIPPPLPRVDLPPRQEGKTVVQSVCSGPCLHTSGCSRRPQRPRAWGWKALNPPSPPPTLEQEDRPSLGALGNGEASSP